MTAHGSISAFRKLLAAFFSCALALALVPTVGFAGETTNNKDDTTIENFQISANIASAEAPVSGFFDRNNEAGNYRGTWEYDPNSKTLTIEPNTRDIDSNGIKYSSCTFSGKPWRLAVKNGLFSETDVDTVIVKPGVFITNSDNKPFSSQNDSQLITPGFINLKNLNLSGLDTTKMTDMSGLFGGLKSLESLDLSHFDTSNVTNMSGMFNGCTKLESIDLSSFKTDKVINMNSMFNDCYALKALNLSMFDTSKVINMNDMFDMCRSLKSITFNDTFIGTNVIETGNMFNGCESLVSLDLSNFDTPRVTNLDHMFTGCSSLTTLNISQLVTIRSSNMDAMFANCKKLEAVYVGGDFTFKGSEADNEKPALLPEGTWISTAEGTEVFSAEKLQEDPKVGPDGTIYLKTPVDIKYLAIKPLETSSHVYTGQAIEPKPHVTLAGSTHELEEGIDFVYVYTNNLNAGTATVGIECIGDVFTGKSQTVTPFTIAPKSIATADVQIPSIAYTGAAREPVPTVTDGETALVRGKDYTVEYANNVLPGTNATATIRGMGNYTGTKKATFQITGTVPSKDPSSPDGSNSQQAEKQTVYRLYNPNSGEHFYTLAAAERDHLKSVGWNDEGIAWTAPKTSKTPVYRLYNPNAGDHHYTTSAGERDVLVKLGWNFENISWYSDDANAVTIYRAYNPNAVAGAHHYTMNRNEYDSLVRLGWHGEGIGWYGASS